MAWLRIDDRVRTHPKIIQAGPSAAWLWFCGLSYCREQLCDGVIDKKVLSSLSVGLKQPRHYAKRLVRVGLWIDKGSHYEIHDYFDWNPSKAEIIAQRKRDLARKRPQQDDPDQTMKTVDNSEWNPKDFQKDSTRLARVRAQDRDRDLSLSRSEDLDLLEDKSAREETTALEPVVGRWVVGQGNPHTRPTNLINGALQRRHAGHVWCAEGRANLCITPDLHEELVGVHQQPEAWVRAWYDQEYAQHPPDQPIGDNRFRFWHNKAQAYVGTVTAPATSRQTKGNASMDAARRVAAKIMNGSFR